MNARIIDNPKYVGSSFITTQNVNNTPTEK